MTGSIERTHTWPWRVPPPGSRDMGRPRLNIAGQLCNTLTAITVVGGTSAKRNHWLCRCSCGAECLQRASRFRSGGAICRICAFLPPGENSFRVLERRYHANARSSGRVFKLTRDEVRVLFASCCAYCGAQPHRTGFKNSRDFVYNGIDRVDNALGYTRANTVPCCKTCNIAKSTRSRAEFVAWLKRAHAHLERYGTAQCPFVNQSRK